jgi:predicted nucleotidyltransferase
MAKQRAHPDQRFGLYRYRSPNIPLAAIRRYARQIVARFQPEKIILFGSYAYGSAHAESDVDLLVVMPSANHTTQAIRICRALEPPFPLDLIVRAPEKLSRRLREGNWFLREIVEKGKVLYAKRNPPLGPQGRIRFRGRKTTRQAKAATPR